MMILFKICIVNYSDRLSPKKTQILLRNFLFVVFTFYIPILFYIAFGRVFLITDLIIFALIIFYKENRGPHELASKTIVILKHRADALDNLKQMTSGGY